ncbi:S-layer homology domain-containing protein [Oscillospiraceae bacterium OttesenSCG-928-G22]|nr:S-layer homology domain-containing protein [Oscillospiraceae bacterium OttesenSCG-928-G22]
MAKTTKRLLALLLSALLLSQIAFAAVTVPGIGEFSREHRVDIAKNTDLVSTTFYHTNRGRSEERYIEYRPNDYAKPVVAYGSSLYGMSTINYVENYLAGQGKTVMAGINGDFFMTDTGLPIGMVITDGILRSSDAGNVAVGFRADGSSFIGKPALSVVAETGDGRSVTLEYVNKNRNYYGCYLFTSDFSGNTRTKREGTNVVLTNVQGNLSLGGTITGTVSSVTTGTEQVPLAAGTMVLSGETSHGMADRLAVFTEGMTVTLRVTAGDSRFHDAVSAVGTGVKLVSNGMREPSLGSTAAPRTAVGVKADGTLVLYTVDGRQSNYSNGMSLDELAARMVSLGCVEAANLDGGGSTVLTGRYPGKDATETMNKPSDGSLRKCANYIFIISSGSAGGEARNLHFYPHDALVLAGGSVPFSLLATNEAYNKAGLPGGIGYSVDDPGMGTVNESGVFTAGSVGGVTKVYASSGNASGYGNVTVVETPTAMFVKNKATGATVESLSVLPGGSAELTVTSFYDGMEVTATDSLYRWEVVGDVGTFTSPGVFAASNVAGAVGTIRVTAGIRTVEIPVTIGAIPVEVESFEGPNTTFASGNQEIRFSLTTDKNFVRYGASAGLVSYDFSNTSASTVTLPVNAELPPNPRYLSLYVYGDGSGNALALSFADADGNALSAELTKLNFTGYRQCFADVPAGAVKLTGLTVHRETDAASGNLAVDQLVALYTKTEDVTAPVISNASATRAEGGVSVTATIADSNQSHLAAKGISMKLDGSPAAFTYDEKGGRLTATVQVPADGRIHKVTIEARDAAGNRSRKTLEISPSGDATEVFKDTKGHWSANYANYLFDKNILRGSEREDGRYYYPENPMTRAEFAVMMASYLALDPAAYANVSLPYTDLGQIPSWAKNQIAAMYELGIIRGKGSGNTVFYDPSAPISRAEMMTILGRTLDKGYGTGAMNFKDAGNVPDYARDYVAILIGMGVVSGYSDGTVLPAKSVTRGEAAKILFYL